MKGHSHKQSLESQGWQMEPANRAQSQDSGAGHNLRDHIVCPLMINTLTFKTQRE